jgi:hypothetical protein
VANLTKTISNTLRFYGVEPANKWGTLVWGADDWAFRDVEWTFFKGIANTLTTDSAITGKNAWKLIEDAIDITTLISREFGYFVSSSFSMSSEITIINISNNNWILSKGGETNALHWPVDNFSIVANPSTSWSEIATPTTTWVNT